jgi:FtsP/CotA-like multicopper oxidase with cupredoxin domain
MTFGAGGKFVWHCRNIVDHDDTEMMRLYRVGPLQPGSP